MSNFARTAKNTTAVFAASAEAAVLSKKSLKKIEKEERIRQRSAARAAHKAQLGIDWYKSGCLSFCDAMSMLRDIPDGCAVSVITDPPYGISIAKWDGKVPGADVWREAYRVLKPGAYCVVAAAPRTYHQTAAALEAAGFEVRDMLIWRYTRSFPGAQAIEGSWRSNLKTNQEPWVVAQKPREKGLTLRQNWDVWGVGGVRTGATGTPGWQTNVIYCPKPDAQERDLGIIPGKFYAIPGAQQSGAWNNSGAVVNKHPTVKPLGLMRRLVKLFTPDYGVVVDPFMGSGSTLIAAAAERCEVFGSDMNWGYWDMTCDRVAWAYENPGLVPPAA